MWPIEDAASTIYRCVELTITKIMSSFLKCATFSLPIGAICPLAVASLTSKVYSITFAKALAFSYEMGFRQ